jgi:uncharacterized membrane protein
MAARSHDYLLQAVIMTIMIMTVATPDEVAGRRSESMPCMKAIYPSMATPGGGAAATTLMVLGFLLPPAAMVSGTCFGSCSR